MEQLQFAGAGDDLGAVVYGEFAIDVLKVYFNGSDRESTSLCNFAIRQFSRCLVVFLER